MGKAAAVPASMAIPYPSSPHHFRHTCDRDNALGAARWTQLLIIAGCEVAILAPRIRNIIRFEDG